MGFTEGHEYSAKVSLETKIIVFQLEKVCFKFIMNHFIEEHLCNNENIEFPTHIVVILQYKYFTFVWF